MVARVCRTDLSRIRGGSALRLSSACAADSLFKGQHHPHMNHSPRVCPSPITHQDQLEEVVPQPIGLQHQIVHVSVSVCVCLGEGRQALTSSNSTALAAAPLCHCVWICALEENVGQLRVHSAVSSSSRASACMPLQLTQPRSWFQQRLGAPIVSRIYRRACNLPEEPLSVRGCVWVGVHAWVCFCVRFSV